MKQPSLQELEEFFHDRELPDTLDFGAHGKVINVKKFVESHILTLRNNSGNKTFLQFYNRLLKAYEMIKNEEK